MDLPHTGTAALLEKLSPFLDDTFINNLLPRPRGRGRRRAFSSAQLFRLNLLCLLTPCNSFNLLVKMLPENRHWRKFCNFRNQYDLPDAKMLHEFRARLDLRSLRKINSQLISPLLPTHLGASRKYLAIMDSTDLEASAHSFKKNKPTAPSMHV